MLLDSQLVPQTTVKPRSFAGLMSLYESNYLRLLRLIPELERLDGCYRSRVAGDCSLYLELIDHSRYTITLTLTYYFEGPDRRRIADPDMLIRAYTDGRLAEAMSYGKKHQHAAFRRLVYEHRQELDARWQRNMVLNKWLDYLVEQGHLILDR